MIAAVKKGEALCCARCRALKAMLAVVVLAYLLTELTAVARPS